MDTIEITTEPKGESKYFYCISRCLTHVETIPLVDTISVTKSKDKALHFCEQFLIREIPETCEQEPIAIDPENPPNYVKGQYYYSVLDEENSDMIESDLELRTQDCIKPHQSILTLVNTECTSEDGEREIRGVYKVTKVPVV